MILLVVEYVPDHTDIYLFENPSDDLRALLVKCHKDFSDESEHKEEMSELLTIMQPIVTGYEPSAPPVLTINGSLTVISTGFIL